MTFINDNRSYFKQKLNKCNSYEFSVLSAAVTNANKHTTPDHPDKNIYILYV